MRETSKMPADGEARMAAGATDTDLVIAYLLYALKDVRALSERSTLLLESAIATLIEETRDRGSADIAERPRPRPQSMLS